MSQSTHPDIIKFIALFERIKEITGDDPGRIPILARNDETFKALCRQLHTLHFSLCSKVRDEGDTIIQNVQPKFIEEWRQYEQEYHPYIGHVSVVHEVLVFHGILSDAPRAPEVSEEVDHENDLHEAREQGNAIRLRLELGSWERNRGLTEELSDKLYNGEKALARQIKSLDLDFEKLIFRENQLRTVHVPTHSSKDATDPLSLVSFLQEAHRAFRLGLNLAAIGICRSVSEVLLRDHYEIAPDSKEFTKRFRLATADPMASQKGADGELTALVRYGSEILHGRRTEAIKHLPMINIPETATLEEVAFHWLKKLVKIVEGIPEK
jgi:hypothetical protein